MSYASKIDEMIGERIAEYEHEQSLKRQLEAYLAANTVPMCQGYPCAVYHPKSVKYEHEIKQLIVNPGGKLSNGVPKVLSADLVGGYPLGVYNPWLYRRPSIY
jgi:hypothetical protein